MKSKFIFLFFACLFTFSYAESFINEDSSFISSDSDFVNSDSSFTNRESSFVSDESSFINKDSSVLNPASSFIDSSGRAIGVYDIVVSKTHQDVYDSVVDSVVQEIVSSSYANGYGKWLEIVSSADASVRKSFVQYFSDWQWQGQNESFFTYAKNRAEREQQIERMYDVALVKFGAGTAIVATTWIVSYVLPSGTIIYASMLLIAKITTMQAISGAVIGGITQAGVSYLQGKRGEELLYATLNGAADGYLVGAITGLATGTFTAIKTFSGAVVIGNNIYTKAGLVLDMKGNLVGKTIRFAGANGVDDIYYIGKNTATVFDRYGKEVARVAKYKDNFVLYNQKGKILGYLKDGKLVSYCDPHNPLIKGQYRAKYKEEIREIVKKKAIMEGKYNSKTGNFIDAIDFTEITSTPEMGHIKGHEYINDLQRAFMNGDPEDVFRELQNNPEIYQLESISANRSHSREGVKLTIDSFKGVNKYISEELWKVLLTQ